MCTANGETAILSIHYKEAPSSLLLHASRPQFSVYIMKKLVAAVAACMKGEIAILCIWYKRSSVLAVAACIKSESASFGIYYASVNSKHQHPPHGIFLR